MIQEALINDLKHLGIKQVRIAEHLGIDAALVCKMFSGHRRMKLDEFALICQLIGKSMNDYMEFADDEC